MFNQIKQITLISLIMFMGIRLSAQQTDSVIYSETDSLQDVMLKQLKASFVKQWLFLV